MDKRLKGSNANYNNVNTAGDRQETCFAGLNPNVDLEVSVKLFLCTYDCVNNSDILKYMLHIRTKFMQKNVYKMNY